MSKNFDLYAIVTDKITAALAEDVVAWHQPWRSGNQGLPVNYASKKPYRGINIFLLGLAGYSSPYWMTYKQAKDKGGSVREGEKATLVVFFKMMDGVRTETDKNGLERKVPSKFPYLRYYNVFNAEQIDGIDFPQPEEPVAFNPIADADAAFDHFAKEVPVRYRGDRAFYSPLTDVITLPKRESFESAEGFYATAFHEAGHATGHEKRLKREGIVNFDKFGSEQYSKEELIAEMTSAFICAEVGIERVTPNAAYIRSWLSKLSDPANKKWVVQASFAAAKAADYIMGRQPQTQTTSEEVAA